MSKLPAIYQQLGDDTDALSAGLTGSFGIISIRSGRFRVKYQGTEQPLLDANQNPLAALDVVIVRANPALSKTFYKSGYQDGSDEAPDCASANGVTPDAHIQQPVSRECAKCPMNVFGSRITPSGSKVKACADVRRIAVVPANDLANDAFGGPMLLRVPAASLGNLADYSRNLRQRGLNSRAVVTRIGFDLEAAYPKLTFRAARMVAEGEIPLVLGAAQNPAVETIVSAGQEHQALPPPVQAAAPVAAIPPPVPVSPPVPVVVAQAPAPQPAADQFFVDTPKPPPPAAAPQGDGFFVGGEVAAPVMAAAQAVAPKKAKPKPAAPAAAPAPVVEVQPAAVDKGAEASLDADIQALLRTLD